MFGTSFLARGFVRRSFHEFGHTLRVFSVRLGSLSNRRSDLRKRAQQFRLFLVWNMVRRFHRRLTLVDSFLAHNHLSQVTRHLSLFIAPRLAVGDSLLITRSAARPLDQR